MVSPRRTGPEKGGALFGLTDGSVQSISDEVDVQDFRHLLNIADGRVPRTIPTFRSAAIVVLEIPRGRTGASARLVAEPVRR